jgi:hypothetical protein
VGAAGGKRRPVVEDVLVVGGPHPHRLGEGVDVVPQIQHLVLEAGEVDAGVDPWEVGRAHLLLQVGAVDGNGSFGDGFSDGPFGTPGNRATTGTLPAPPNR